MGSNGTENRLKESRRGSDDHVPGAHRVMLHNVVDLIKVLNEMINEGHEVTPECVQRLSPYMTEHVKRFGQYVLDMNMTPGPLDLPKLGVA